MGIDEFYYLILRTNLLCCNLIKFIAQPLQFGLYHGKIDILFPIKIGVKGAAPFARGDSYIIHCRTCQSVFRKQLASHIY